MDLYGKDLEYRASLYVRLRGRFLGRPLGHGKDGSVFEAYGSSLGPTAVKALRRRELYEREVACYRRLAELEVVQVRGHNVPQLLGYDDALLVLEMTIVTKPYVLDFAGAYLDEPPKFPWEVMEERYARWADDFGDRWHEAQLIIAAFSSHGIHLLDPSPWNIAFEDEEQ